MDRHAAWRAIRIGGGSKFETTALATPAIANTAGGFIELDGAL
jgi:hypothetical protein